MEYLRSFQETFLENISNLIIGFVVQKIHKFIIMLHNTIKKIQLMLSKIMNYIDLPFTYVSTFVKSSAVVCVV